MSDKGRAYNSPLREQRRAETRARIVDAAIKLLGMGAHQMTIPAVAKEAGVAVPTVYRHFPSKVELEEGVIDHVRQLAGVRRPFDGIEGLREHIRQNWATAERYPPGTLPLLMANIASNLGRRDQAERRGYVEDCLGSDLEALSEENRERFITVVQALASSPGGVAMMRTGLSSDESAELTAWVLTTLYQSLKHVDP